MTGEVIGRLTVIERVGVAKDKQIVWRCRCECGNETHVRGGKLRQAKIVSCGCLRRERLAAGLGRGLSHPSHRGDEITYTAAHMRTRRANGPASSRACVDCGDRANDWSLRHDSGKRLFTQTGMAFSPEPSDYEPRCRLCHKRYDMAVT